MFETLSQGFARAKDLINNQVTLRAENIAPAVREIRVALLEADVEAKVVRRFLDTLEQRAIGEVLPRSVKQSGKPGKLSLTAADHFVKICHQELVKLMGKSPDVPIVFHRPLTRIMLVGLQGTGKTTTCSKLGHYLATQKRKVLLVAADTQRPAAAEQLKVLGDKLGLAVFSRTNLAAVDICQQAMAYAKAQHFDVVILDTAGRLAVDTPLMDELLHIKQLTHPHAIFLVADAMAGQNAVHSVQAFHQKIDLTGLILTKLDGDARGGSALAMRTLTNLPIVFIGTGEGPRSLEVFRPEGLASRILGMGDIVGLVDEFEAVVDQKEAEAHNKKLLKGQFNYNDFLIQLRNLQKLGPIQHVIGRIPGLANPSAPSLPDNVLQRSQAIILSMTPAERQNPKLIDASRTRRIARGCGQSEQELQAFFQRFAMMQQVGKQPELLAQMPGMQTMLAQSSAQIPAQRWGQMGFPTELMPQATGGVSATSKNKQKLKEKRKAQAKARKKSRR